MQNKIPAPVMMLRMPSPPLERPDQVMFFWKTGKGFPNGYLSTWHLSPFVHEGNVYLTVHQWMAVQKARFFGDKATEAKLHGIVDLEKISTIAARIKEDGTKRWGNDPYSF